MPRKPYIGDPSPTDEHTDDVLKLTPSWDHVVRTWRPKTGKPTSLTEEVLELVATRVAGGATIPQACACVGISKTTWANWNLKSKLHADEGLEGGFGPDQSPYVAWGEAMYEAKSAWIVSAINRIDRQLPGWQSLAWLLERRYPEFWMERKQQQVNIKTEAQAAQEKSTEQLEAEMALYLKEKNS